MLICKQKINFITYFFLNILQRNSKLVILGNLEMSGPRNWQYQFEEAFYLQTKNELNISPFPWDIAKTLQTCYFGYFGHTWLQTPTVILLTGRKFLSLSAYKKSTSSPYFSGDMAVDMQTPYFGYFGNAWFMHTQNDSISL